MTNTSNYSSQFSADVETMTINDGGNSWDRVRSSDELTLFRERLLSRVGELDETEYTFAA